MNRRQFFTGASGVSYSTSDRPFSSSGNQTKNLIRSQKGIEPIPAAEWNAKTAAHLLRRTMFGPTRAEIQQAASQSMDATINALFAPQPLPDPPVGPAPLAAGQTWVTSAFDSTNDGTYSAYLKAWWVGLMIRQGMSIREKMVLFWHNHFPTELDTVTDSRYLYRQLDLFRRNALGNFKQLTKLVTLDPAMLLYLNGNTNVVGRANENYGRELQELFTIGKGAEIAQGNYTNYTEQDVQAAARMLTGYTVTGYRDTTSAAIGSTFTASRHDSTSKQFSSAYGNKVFAGRAGTDGAKELDDLLDMIFAQTDADGVGRVAKYMCRKFYRWFVYYDIDAAAEQNVIVPLARTMMANNYEVQPVLDALFRSANFYDDINIGCVIKNPIDFVAGTVRQLGISVPPMTDTSYYRPLNDLRSRASNLQMNLLDPPNVAGWEAYYQVPDFYELWISTTTLPLRAGVGGFTDLLFTGVSGLTLDRLVFAKTMGTPGDPYKLIAELADALFPIPLTQSQKDYLMYNAMGLKLMDEYEWTAVWNAYWAPGGQTTVNKTNVLKSLDPLLKFMFRMAEFQLS
ncbi:MAG: DUF1800 domain-containing protein [Ignavibacteriales bacterium]|nr:DUF1800 domain-containing protein [Ignavibacteriales bacterium]